MCIEHLQEQDAGLALLGRPHRCRGLLRGRLLDELGGHERVDRLCAYRASVDRFRAGACYSMSVLTRRLQVLLDDRRYQRLEAAARRRRVSVATVVREAIDRDLGSPALDRSAAGRRFLAAPSMEVGSVEDVLAGIDQPRGRRV